MHEPFPKHCLNQTVAHRFEWVVERHANRIALTDGQTTLTYDQLDRAANRIANTLLEHGGESDEPVGILLPQTVWPVVAVMGILKAGKAYVPLDPAMTPGQISAIIDHSGMQMIVTDLDISVSMSHLVPATVRQVLTDKTIEHCSDGKPPDSGGPDSLSYILYTSGTTGEPKGVYADQRSLLHLTMRFSNLIQVRPDDRFSLARSIRVGGSVKDIFSSLLNGATLIVFDFPRIGLADLVRGFRQNQISVVSMMLSVFREMAQSLEGQERLLDLRLLLVGGEMMKPQDTRTLLDLAAPDAQLLHAYAITEMGNIVTAQLYETSLAGDDLVCAGLPLPAMDMRIVDENNTTLPSGQVGRVACRSAYLPYGYWRDPHLTEGRFFVAPEEPGIRMFVSNDLGYLDESGRLFLKCRVDHMVRIDGQFVDTKEVEHRLLQFFDFKQAEVVAYQTDQGFTQLVAYIKTAKTPAPTADQLRRRLSTVLSAVQMPARFVFLDSFPLTLSGKLDRDRLPGPGNVRPQLATPVVPPTTPLEEAIVSIWQDVLEIDGIGVCDPFFDLGGNSLQAMRVAAYIQTAFAVGIDGADLFAKATVRQAALMVIAALIEESDIVVPETIGDACHSQDDQAVQATRITIGPAQLRSDDFVPDRSSNRRYTLMSEPEKARTE